MERILGLDLGSRTCGIAMSDALGMIAHGVETYRFEENNYKSAARHIQKIVESFVFDEIFGRNIVAELLALRSSSVSKLFSKLIKAEIIEPVSGYGKGKYRFVRDDHAK